MQGAKADKLGFTLQYTCIDKNEARFKRGISNVLILTLIGKLWCSRLKSD